jgi:hypothetical protein
MTMSQTNKSFWGMKLLCLFGFIGFVIVKGVDVLENANVTDMQYVSGRGFNYRPLMVGLTLINGAAAKGAGNPSIHVLLGFCINSYTTMFCSIVFCF